MARDMDDVAERADDAQKKTLPLADHAYQYVVSAIRGGTFHPGERVKESDIAEALNMSRTPVREAFRRLHSEGRITIEPQRGAFVAELDMQEISELYAVRQHLEGMAAAFAARHASDAEIAAMQEIFLRSTELKDDPRALNQLNWELHYVIFAAARNRYLRRIVTLLADDLAMLRGTKYIPSDRPVTLIEEHRKIVEAITARDPERANIAAQEHVKSAHKMHLDAHLHSARTQAVSNFRT